MLSLLYVSTSDRLMSDDELVEILRLSRKNNAELGITGMLLYKGGTFMQVIEGPEDAVEKLYKKIEKDPRHYNLIMLASETIEERQFPKWEMAFQNLDHVSVRDEPGYSRFLEKDFNVDEFRKDPKQAYVLLLSFRKNLE